MGEWPSQFLWSWAQFPLNSTLILTHTWASWKFTPKYYKQHGNMWCTFTSVIWHKKEKAKNIFIPLCNVLNMLIQVFIDSISILCSFSHIQERTSLSFSFFSCLLICRIFHTDDISRINRTKWKPSRAHTLIIR